MFYILWIIRDYGVVFRSCYWFLWVLELNLSVDLVVIKLTRLMGVGCSELHGYKALRFYTDKPGLRGLPLFIAVPDSSVISTRSMMEHAGSWLPAEPYRSWGVTCIIGLLPPATTHRAPVLVLWGSCLDVPTTFATVVICFW